MKRGSLGYPVPMAKLFATGEPELRKSIADMEFHGVDADTHPFANATIGHAVPHLFRDLPFCGRQHVIVRWASRSIRAHQSNSSHSRAELPYPVRRAVKLGFNKCVALDSTG